MTNIYLTGYRCTGKTSIGKMLAGKMAFDFVDADEWLVNDAGMSVARIVEQFGWDDFRNRESAILKKISAGKNQVVATGGGVILRDNNRSIMKETGTVVWLKASVSTIAARMDGDEKTQGQRPGLTDKGAILEIEETLIKRIPMYKQAMDFSVDTDGKDLDDICHVILNEMGIL
ncbi:MAG: shikimate kinase [Proteobacteria bacterium]|nr:shikimate kinase [Pseudomonadota bacterium]